MRTLPVLCVTWAVGEAGQLLQGGTLAWDLCPHGWQTVLDTPPCSECCGGEAVEGTVCAGRPLHAADLLTVGAVLSALTQLRLEVRFSLFRALVCPTLFLFYP